ncbi:hypothetical protein PUR28_00115, partial [Streptomyces sp. BE308]|uniref:hypothetical protein n=1 Tax=Streptomyces sp. BE308 TaxID=3002529 RepID=UPI002E78A088
GQTEYARVFSEEHALRCRLALHQGLVTEDPQGWSGDAVNTACRLVDRQLPGAGHPAPPRDR